MARRSPSSPKDSKEFAIKTFISGGVAGCCAKTTVAPFDRIKILLQAHHKNYKHLGLVSAVTRVVRWEGLMGLYRGNGAQMVRIFPYAAVQFTSYEHYKQWLRLHFGPGHLSKLAAGSLAGMTAVILTYPLDVVRTRLAFQVAGETVYAGIFDAFRVMLTREGGLRALYKGIVPTMLGMAPYAGLSFYCFESLKVFLLEKFPDVFGKPCSMGDGSLVLIIPAKLICGGLAGAFAQTVSNWYTTLRVVFTEHGVKKGLYRGLSINYIKVTPMVAVSFSMYELMKQLLGLDTHAER